MPLQVHMVNIPLIFLSRDIWPFARVYVHQGKENTLTFQGLSYMGSETDPWDLNSYCSPKVREREREFMEARWLIESWPWSISKWVHWVCRPILWLYLWSPRVQLEQTYLQLAESSHQFPGLWRKGHYASNDQVEASEIDQLPRFFTDQKSNRKHSPGEIAEVGAVIKGLKDVRVMVSSHHLIYLSGPCRDQMITGTWW